MKQKWCLGLDDQGREIVNTQKMSVTLRVGLSAEQKLKEMLARELARDKEDDEYNIDDYDFELPNEEVMLHTSVRTDGITKKDIYESIKEQKKAAAAAKKSAGEDSAGRKPATTGRAKRVDSQDSKEFADGSPDRKVANEEEES